jgi:hypothetical protein
VPGKQNAVADGLSRRPDLRLMVIGAIAPYDPWLKGINDAAKTDHDAQKFRKRALQQPTGAVQDGFVL